MLYVQLTQCTKNVLLCSAVYKTVLINLVRIFFQCCDFFWINSCSNLPVVFCLWLSIQLLSTLDKIPVTSTDFMRFQCLYKSPITEAFICEKRSGVIVSRSKTCHLPILNTSVIDMKQLHYLQVEGYNDYPGNVSHFYLEENY